MLNYNSLNNTCCVYNNEVVAPSGVAHFVYQNVSAPNGSLAVIDLFATSLRLALIRLNKLMLYHGNYKKASSTIRNYNGCTSFYIRRSYP